MTLDDEIAEVMAPDGRLHLTVESFMSRACSLPPATCVVVTEFHHRLMGPWGIYTSVCERLHYYGLAISKQIMGREIVLKNGTRILFIHWHEDGGGLRGFRADAVLRV